MRREILLVLPLHRQCCLLNLLEEAGLKVSSAADLQEAQGKLSGPPSYDLVFVDAELPDGSWLDLLEFILDTKRACEMIVCSRLGDERLWAEVIQRGAYDLIAEPYEQQQVLRIVQGALDGRQMQRMIRARQ
ncbi:MAG: response regulator [Acidobacteria bacterium]|nr:response regulator [Acidobacteriota bacterium]